MADKTDLSKRVIPRTEMSRETPTPYTPGTDSTRIKSVANYRMDHPRRGIAAIFNHETFEDSIVSERRGSEKDVESLCRTFGRLGFKIETYFDLSFSAIEKALQNLSRRNHSDCDCFVLVFMSHGLEGKLRARDCVFDVNCLWDYFTPDQAPSLANKPKIFIIQACQGHGRQSGVRVAGEVECAGVDDTVTLVPRYILPSTSDFLIALSTIPGFVSWRSPQQGSWYIQTLCEHLDRQGFDNDIVTLLTHVGREIAVEYTVLDMQDISSSYKKQLPSIISLLAKKVKFTKKEKKTCGKPRKTKRNAEDNEDDMEDDTENKRHKPKRLKTSNPSKSTEK